MTHLLRPLWRKVSNGPRERQALAFLRMAAGLFFLYFGLQKFNNPEFPVLMATAVKGWAATHPQAIYQAFLETVVLPNSLFFARLVTWGELAIGVSYLSGALIRYSAPAAMFLNVNILLATQHTGVAALGLNLAFLGIHFTIWWARAGFCYGLDSLLQRWMPSATSPKSQSTTKQGGKASRRGANGPSPSTRTSLKLAGRSHQKQAVSLHPGHPLKNVIKNPLLPPQSPAPTEPDVPKPSAPKSPPFTRKHERRCARAFAQDSGFTRLANSYRTGAN